MSNIYKSKEWAELKDKLIIRAKGKCERCGSNTMLESHHKDGSSSTYNDYNPNNYLLLCHNCHESTFQAQKSKEQIERNSQLNDNSMYEFVIDKSHHGGFEDEPDGSTKLFFLETTTGAVASTRVTPIFDDVSRKKVNMLRDRILQQPEKTFVVYAIVKVNYGKNGYRYNNLIPSSIVVVD